MAPVYGSIDELVGGTPLLELNRWNENKQVRILAKLEAHNVAGSAKDRVALQMIRQAEANTAALSDAAVGVAPQKVTRSALDQILTGDLNGGLESGVINAIQNTHGYTNLAKKAAKKAAATA